MDIVSLSMDFNTLAKTGVALTQGVVGTLITDGLAALLSAAAAVTVVNHFHTRKTRKAIMDGNFENDHAVFGETLYLPSGIVNPETGQEFIDQSMNTIAPNIEVEKIFPPPFNITLVSYIMKASRYCTDENPIVFAHLDKVIKNPRELDQTRKAIAQCWVNYFSGFMRKDRVGERKGARSVPERQGYIAVLTFEPSADTRKFRILWFDKKDIVNGNLPEAANVRIEVRHEVFEHQPAHHYMQRLATNRVIHAYLNAPEGVWLRDTTSLSLATGRFRKVPAPVMGGVGAPA